MNANEKATHTVTSHWYRSSRACGVGSGEWVGMQTAYILQHNLGADLLGSLTSASPM